MLVDFEVRGQLGMDFFTGGSNIMDYGFVSNKYTAFSLYKVLIYRLESCGLFVDYGDVFIRCLIYHGGTHSLSIDIMLK